VPPLGPTAPSAAGDVTSPSPPPPPPPPPPLPPDGTAATRERDRPGMLLMISRLLS
jgi:hypothetical protein